MLSGQNGSLKGTITDNGMNDEPVLFANVQLKGAALNAETNFHGNFEIDNITPGEYTLIISYPGYETIEATAVVEENKIVKIDKGLNPLSLASIDFELINAVSVREEVPILRYKL